MTIYKSLNENNKGRSFEKNENVDSNEKPLDLLDLTQGVQVSASPPSENVLESKKKDE